MPIIHIYAKNNKTVDMKRQVVKDITESFVKNTNVPADVVQVFWHDMDDHNYARGGELLLDRDKK